MEEQPDQNQSLSPEKTSAVDEPEKSPSDTATQHPRSVSVYLLKALGQLPCTPQDDEERLKTLRAWPAELLHGKRRAAHYERFKLLTDFPKLQDELIRESHPQFEKLQLLDRDIRLYAAAAAIAEREAAAEQKLESLTVRGEAAPGVETAPATVPDRRVEVNDFIRKCLEETGTTVTRKQIWLAAGYRSRTDFELWQRRDKRATKKAAAMFTGILAMKPAEFIERLRRQDLLR